MSAAAPELVEDELDLVRRLLPLAGARVADVGCGAAQLSRRLLECGLASTVAALEVDRAQQGPGGAHFERPMRANVLRRPAP